MALPGIEMWNNRYSAEEYAYGTTPNSFLKEQMVKLEPGKVLFAAEGEGRNAVFAASLGWDVSAFDISITGKKKAQKLASRERVTIDYRVGLLPDLMFEEESFDAIVLVYAHFPPTVRSDYHRLLNRYLKKGGIVILEAFSKKHLEFRLKNEKVGGPKNLDALISKEDVKADFSNYQAVVLVEEEVDLKEGLYHNGMGSVTRFIGTKK